MQLPGDPDSEPGFDSCVFSRIESQFSGYGVHGTFSLSFGEMQLAVAYLGAIMRLATYSFVLTIGPWLMHETDLRVMIYFLVGFS